MSSNSRLSASNFSVNWRIESGPSASCACLPSCDAGETLLPISGRLMREVLLLCSRVIGGAATEVTTSARALFGRIIGVGV